MAAPQDSPEQAYRLRKFQGTGTEIDSTFLGPSYLAKSQNWIPTQSYRLGKRPGTTLLGHLGTEAGSTVTHLLAAHAPDGTAHLFAYAAGPPAPFGGIVMESIMEGAFAPVPGITFPSSTPGRTILFRDRVFAGNGVDPLKSWLITDTDPAKVQVYGPLTDLTDLGSVDFQTNPPNQISLAIPPGDYSWCFATFSPAASTADPTATGDGLYHARSKPQIWTVGNHDSNSTGEQLKVTAPAAALPGGMRYRLFLSPRNYPIEYATAQGQDWNAGETRILSSVDVTDDKVPLYGGGATNYFRTGSMFLIWQNRLVFAGMASEPYAVFATDTMLPGLEQSIYNSGTLFPVFAKVPLPRKVTGIGVAGVTTDQQATAPLLFFTESQTFLVQGDPFLSSIELEAGATPATMEEISSRVGCVSHDTIVNTPAGTIFVGIDSVYLIPPGGGYPQDIGWPIADQIRAIPMPARSRLSACFHKQFYKLAIPSVAGAAADQQWWLDLRLGLSGTPSWWGPHALGQNPAMGVPAFGVSAMCADPSSPFEVDRGYLAVANSDVILLHHQLGYFADYDPTGGHPLGIGVYSVLQTGRFDADQPFIAKVLTRLRVICQTTAKSSIGVTVIVDNGISTLLDDILLGEGMDPAGEFVQGPDPFPDPPFPPTYKCFFGAPRGDGDPPGDARFATISPAEAQTIAPYSRPRFLSIQSVLTHGPDPATDPKLTVPGVELRDFELLYIPSERKVRYTSDTRGLPQYGPERVSG